MEVMRAPEAGQVSRHDIRRRAIESRRWLLDDVFPLWSSAGFDDRSGQFIEQLTLTGEPLKHVPRRTLVQARQLYVFAVAGQMGWDGPWRAVMSAVADGLLARGRMDDGDWIFAFGADGRPLDLRRDLYTQAFAIFGLVHAAAALGRTDLMAAARETRDRLTSAWRAPVGGFVEGDLFPGARRQNPHMHLFEAVMALCEGGGDLVDIALADELWTLFKRRFATSSGVLEYFDEKLEPLAGDAGRVSEPGHGFEWSWLAARWSELSGTDEWALADKLYAFGRRGVAPEGMACDELWINGTVKTASARCWPQTEYLKAALSRHERLGTLAAADVCAAHDAVLGYLCDVCPGGWRDRRLADGGWEHGPSPASSAYHLVCALNELVRLHADPGRSAGDHVG
jgi:mannose-6-phosphate isomerase